MVGTLTTVLVSAFTYCLDLQVAEQNLPFQFPADPFPVQPLFACSKWRCSMKYEFNGRRPSGAPWWIQASILRHWTGRARCRATSSARRGPIWPSPGVADREDGDEEVVQEAQPAIQGRGAPRSFGTNSCSRKSGALTARCGSTQHRDRPAALLVETGAAGGLHIHLVEIGAVGNIACIPATPTCTIMH